MTEAAEVREITNTVEWLAWRRHDLTASPIGALFDCHPYMTLDDLVAAMRGQSVKGFSLAMRAGQLLEHVFPAAIAEVHPEWRIVKATTYHRLPSLRLGCTPDFWVYLNSSTSPIGLIQAKTANEREWERWQGRPPLGYMLQTLVELIVTGCAWGVLAVIVRNSTLPLYLFDVPRHPAAESRILAAAADFWRRSDAGEFPVVMPKDEIEALLDDGSHRDLSDDNYLPEALERRETLLSKRGEAEKAIKDIDYQIKQRVGPARTAWLPGWAISWQTQHRKEFTVPEADVRILRIKRTEDDNG